ncbi:hypothetical protein E4U55_001469 [Claviceps digitariae]|nr:hypothetical protein E4U55_001469 [Claviceps digitariae]
MAQLDTYDIISIVGLPIYAAFLACAVFLCVKHGLSRSAGWYFLVILSISRLISFGMRLALVNDPTNMSLWSGWSIINSLGLAPLILLLLALLMRVFESINRQGHVVLKPLHQRLIQAVVLVALILGIVGGTNSSYSTENGVVKINFNTLTQAGVGLMIAAVVALCVEAVVALRSQGFVAQGEHRILLGVVASIPFLIMRVVYSCLTAFVGITSNVWVYLCLSILSEAAIILMLEVLGLSLKKAPRQTKDENDPEMVAGRQ